MSHLYYCIHVHIELCFASYVSGILTQPRYPPQSGDTRGPSGCCRPLFCAALYVRRCSRKQESPRRCRLGASSTRAHCSTRQRPARALGNVSVTRTAPMPPLPQRPTASATGPGDQTSRLWPRRHQLPRATRLRHTQHHKSALRCPRDASTVCFRTDSPTTRRSSARELHACRRGLFMTVETSAADKCAINKCIAGIYLRDTEACAKKRAKMR